MYIYREREEGRTRVSWFITVTEIYIYIHSSPPPSHSLTVAFWIFKILFRFPHLHIFHRESSVFFLFYFILFFSLVHFSFSFSPLFVRFHPRPPAYFTDTPAISKTTPFGFPAPTLFTGVWVIIPRRRRVEARFSLFFLSFLNAFFSRWMMMDDWSSIYLSIYLSASRSFSETGRKSLFVPRSFVSPYCVTLSLPLVF